MKCQALFSLEKKIKMSYAEVVIGILRINIFLVNLEQAHTDCLVRCTKSDEGMANSLDPDHTAALSLQGRVRHVSMNI